MVNNTPASTRTESWSKERVGRVELGSKERVGMVELRSKEGVGRVELGSKERVGRVELRSSSILSDPNPPHLTPALQSLQSST